MLQEDSKERGRGQNPIACTTFKNLLWTVKRFGVAFLEELLEWDRTFSGFLG